MQTDKSTHDHDTQYGDRARLAPVVIAGGGPVGLAAAALLTRLGMPVMVLEADEGYCTGSRAICISRRSQEIFGWFGADRPLVDKGLSWVGGRSYFRDREVLHFRMPSAADDRFAPMLNIQQYYIEQMAHTAAAQHGALLDLRWRTRVTAVTQTPDGVTVTAQGPDGPMTVHTPWLIACDGGRSTVRECLGLQLEGIQYEGRYVIVDIEQASDRPVERLAWFDPPSNPGSTLLMHRQPDQVWRVDYQLRDDEDPEEAIRPENVLPRVRSHLEMIGETAAWKPLWISIYNAKCLTLARYRHGRVLFAGDAGHLVPIFGVRGLNSGLDDVANLAWKLALVCRGQASDRLLDSYSDERVHATRQNIAYGAKSTEFMAPPHFGFRLMREAVLRLAPSNEAVRNLINPRQSAPVPYPASALALNVTSADDATRPGPGDPAPDAPVGGLDAVTHLSQLLGHGFVLLLFSADPLDEQEALLQPQAASGAPAGLTVWRIVRSASDASADRAPDGARRAASSRCLHDLSGEAHRRYGATDGTMVLLRPDGYVLGRWRTPRWAWIRQALHGTALADALLLPHQQADAAQNFIQKDGA